MNGKKSSVTLCKEGQEFMGNVVKEIAVSGSVYICLTKSPQYTWMTDLIEVNDN